MINRTRPGHGIARVRAHQTRRIDSNHELHVATTGPSGNKKKRNKGKFLQSKPLVEGTCDGISDEARDPLDASTISRSRYHGKSPLPKQRAQKTQHGRSKHEDGLKSSANNKKEAVHDRKKQEDTGTRNIQKTLCARCGGDDPYRERLKPTPTRFDDNPLKRVKGLNSKVDDEPNLSPRDFRKAAASYSKENQEESSHFDSWCSWPFKNQIILIDLSSSKLSRYQATLKESLRRIAPHKERRRKSSGSRKSSSSSSHNTSHTASEIDAMLDKLVDGPLKRINEIVEDILDVISFAFSNRCLCTNKSSRKRR